MADDVIGDEKANSITVGSSDNKFIDAMVKHQKYVWGAVLLMGIYLLFFIPGTGITGTKLAGIALAIIALIFLSLPKTDNRYEQELAVAWEEFRLSPTGQAMGVGRWSDYIKTDRIRTQEGHMIRRLEVKPFRQFWLIKIPTITNDPEVFLIRRYLKPNANQVRFCGYIEPWRTKSMPDNDFDVWADKIADDELKDVKKDTELGILRGMMGGRSRGRRIFRRNQQNNVGDYSPAPE